MLIPISDNALVDPTRVIGVVRKEGKTFLWLEGGFTISFGQDTPHDVASALGLEV